jgi:glycolate oxidase iron-sulfur subunit
MGKRTGLAERLAEKTEDIARFALKHFSRLEGKFKKKQEKVRVTYHAPCHERNHGGSLEVLKLLKSLPNIEYAHAENYDSCCGGGGTFFCDFPGISKKMTDKKLEEAKRTGAQFWVSGCPGCIINLGGCITDGELTMIHPAELLADAIYG